MSSLIRGLAIETTSRRGEVALVQDGAVIRHDAFAAGARHTADLLPLIDSLLRAQGWRPAEVDEVYVSVGPGAFTGMRVGVTFAKTFAFVTEAKVVAVPTPRVVVENAPAGAHHAAVIVDARRGSVWAEAFEHRLAGWSSVERFGLSTMRDVLAALPRPVVLVGEGVKYHAAALDPQDAGVSVCEDVQPRAEVVAQVGWSLAREGRFTDPFVLEPVYVRRPEAEEKRLGEAKSEG